MTQAITNYRRALELRPDFESARVGLERVTSQATAAKKAISPFGRLVDVQQIGSGIHHMDSPNYPPRHDLKTACPYRVSKEVESVSAVL